MIQKRAGLLSDDDDLARVLAGVCAGGSSAAAVDKELAGWVENQRTAAKQGASEAKAAEERVWAEAKAKAEAMRARMASGEPFQAEAGERLVFGLAVRWIRNGRFAMGNPTTEPDRDSNGGTSPMVKNCTLSYVWLRFSEENA